MAYTYIWPVTLPQKPQTNFSETGGVLIIRTPTDAGPAKQRRRGNRPQQLSCSFNMTTAQLDTFETFVKDTLSGTTRFGFTHPRTNQVVEVRLIPQQDGQLYTIGYILEGFWTVSMQMEVLP